MGKEYEIPKQTIDDITLLEPEATYSYADYLCWSFEERVELIRGKVFRMSPAPARKHQDTSFNLTREFGNFLKGNPCKGYSAPFDVRFPKDKNDPVSQVFTVVQPDLCVICDHEKLDDAGCNGAPDLIVEILSPSTAAKDLKHKYRLYEEHGVKEYWVVYPEIQVVEVFCLEEEQTYATGKKYTQEDEIASRTLPGLVIRLRDVFTD